MVIRSDLRTKVNSAEDNIRGINYCDEYKYLEAMWQVLFQIRLRQPAK